MSIGRSTVLRSTDNIYVNIAIDHPTTIYNPNPLIPPQKTEPVTAEFNQCFTNPLLAKSSDYYLSVTRFDIPLNSIPLYVMNQIIPNQGNPNLTKLIIGFSLGGVAYPIYLTFLPNGGFDVPDQSNSLQQIITPYYYCYSYQILLDMINNAINVSWILSGIGGPFGLFPLATAPYFYLESSTSLITLVIPQQFKNVPAIDMFCNDALLNYIDGFPVKFNGFNSASGKDFVFDFSSLKPNDAYALPPDTISTPPSYYKIEQEFSTLAIWSSLKKIVLSTSKIPINTELIPIAGNTNLGINNSFPILTDFVPIINRAGDSKGIAYYLPSAQYHLVDIFNDGPLQDIDLKIFWQDINGNLNPVQITQNQQINIKLAFLKKSLYKNE